MERTRTIMITGATAGIGLATAVGVAKAGCRVVIHGRSEEKCVAAAGHVQEAVPGSHVELVVGDLASLSDVRKLALGLLERHEVIDVLINNAGSFTTRRRETADGLEMQFGVNHAAHFLLTLALLPAIHRSPTGRVITVSSGSHFNGRMNWRDLQLRRFYNGVSAYGQSKLANVLFSYELQRRLAGSSHVQSYAIEPGLVNTALGGKATGPLARLVWSRRRRHGVSPEEGAATSVYLATSAGAEILGGTYWGKCRPMDSARASHDKESAERLWDRSEEICDVRIADVLGQLGK